MNILVQLGWGLLALIHLMPAFASVRPALLTQLYGIQAGDAAYLLLQHRAALFVAVLVLCSWSVVSSGPRPAAAVVTAISMVSFLLLYWQAGSPAAFRTIALADLIGLPALVLVGWAAFRP